MSENFTKWYDSMTFPLTVAIAMDSFKGSLSSIEAADAVAEGLKNVFPGATSIAVPVADGGEGTVDAVLTALGGKRVELEVTGPQGTPVVAGYGITHDGVLAIIEMAAASGLTLIPKNKRNPMQATTFGTGELILDAVKRGVQKIIIGIGGSATVDGGVGLAQALGVGFLDKSGQPLAAPLMAADIGRIAQIDCSQIGEAVRVIEFVAACDVDNVLCGPLGAAEVFGRQKGATEADIAVLDKSLRQYAECIAATAGIEIAGLPRTGAGGGVTAALHAFLGAKLLHGIELIIETIHFKDQIGAADMVVTGEGFIDSQTVFGKTPVGIAKAAKELGMPVVAIGGQVAACAVDVYRHGVDCLESAYTEDIGVDAAMANARGALVQASERSFRQIRLGYQLGIKK
ncbi:glycerate kinase [Kordiimonas pumila]|uniref:Glycerate kinase n=1 Tax=Kordiimonas pumila TaxID=2161677 RepID=A0ABV7D7C9_9PROT|nr:glycerate kinase [Kordiimonas pumila]